MRDAIRFLGELCPVPIACIPNAGCAAGPRRRDDLPETPEPLADALKEFVERYGVESSVAAATTPSTSARLPSASRADRWARAPSPVPRICRR